MSLLIENMKDSLFPNRCLCGKIDETLCSDCYNQIPKNKTDLCPLCRKISPFGKTCENCRSKSYLTGVLIFGKHEGVLKDAIWSYKYEFIRDLSHPLANLLQEKYSEYIIGKNFLITCVPISTERYRERGYNQSAELAKELSKNCNLEFRELLGRNYSPRQVGKSKKERAQNIKGKIFFAEAGITLKNSRILLVDDVYTTGSTLEECAKILRESGSAREVWGIVLSRD